MTVSVKTRLGRVLWVAAGIVTTLATPALADETVLAASKTRKLQVLAEGGSAWCKPMVRLRMVLEPDSPDLGNPAAQVEIMNRLKTPLTTDCKTVKGALLTVFEHDKPTGTYQADADAGWIFAAVPNAAPVVAQSPPPAAPAAITAPPRTQPTVPPRDVNYAAAMIQLVKHNPALIQDDGFIRCWAASHFERDYNQFRQQEFRLKQILQQAQADLETAVAQSDGEHMTVLVNASFDSYDFNRQAFPISLRDDNLKFSPRCHNIDSRSLPDMAILKISNLDDISGLPMGSDDARAFADRRTRYGSINRQVAIALTVKLDPSGFAKGSWGEVAAGGTVESAVFYADFTATQPIYSLSSEDLERMREERAVEKAAQAKAEEDRQAERRRQQMAAQRMRDIQALANASTSVKLANWILPDMVSLTTDLDDLRSARARSLQLSAPTRVAMLVQTKGDGRSNVATTWPGKLEITVDEGQPDLSSSRWYLVFGRLSASADDPLGPSRLQAQRVYACAQPECADATDPTTIVDSKLAGSSQAQ